MKYGERYFGSILIFLTIYIHPEVFAFDEDTGLIKLLKNGDRSMTGLDFDQTIENLKLNSQNLEDWLRFFPQKDSSFLLARVCQSLLNKDDFSFSESRIPFSTVQNLFETRIKSDYKTIFTKRIITRIILQSDLFFIGYKFLLSSQHFIIPKDHSVKRLKNFDFISVLNITTDCSCGIQT